MTGRMRLIAPAGLALTLGGAVALLLNGAVLGCLGLLLAGVELVGIANYSEFGQH